MTVGQNSRHNHSAIIRTADGAGNLLEHDHLDIRPRVSGTTYVGHTEYKVSDVDTWSRIAWAKLGDSKLWWVIADLSDVVDPYDDLHPEPQLEYRTQLGANYVVGTSTYMQLVKSKGIEMGQLLQIDHLASTATMQVQVVAVDTTLHRLAVRVVSSSNLSGGTTLLAATSRVSEVQRAERRLIVPNYNQMAMTALDFGNQITKLEGV